jgi:hypothetical protein
MSILIPNIWTWICIAFAIMLLAALIMSVQGRYFFSKDVVLRKFSIMDLQFASTGQEIVNIVKGIYLLPAEKSRKVVAALRSQLYVDFVFIPAVYGGIFLLCMKVAEKMLSGVGENFFAALAWLQIVPVFCDVFENLYLLKRLKPNAPVSDSQTHKNFQRLVAMKWGVSLFATVCSLAALCYFWLSGFYSIDSLPYALILAAELGLFIISGKIISGKLKPLIEG